ncbi:hypothetical protein KR074_004203, partial [Drosophila pseudoananassae]
FCCFSTHKLKLVVVLLTLVVAIDGEVKASTSGTVLLYHMNTKFRDFLISRVVLGCLLTTWASGGFLALFWDSVRALAIILVSIAGWWLTYRLHRHYKDEMKYEQDHRHLQKIL